MIMVSPASPTFRFNGGGRIKLAQDMKVFWKIGTRPFEIPEGSTSDLASVPRWLQPIFPKVGENSIAAIIHDHLYKTGQLSKKDADDIFLDAMLHYGVKPWRAEAMYLAVHLFGASTWNDYRAKDA